MCRAMSAFGGKADVRAKGRNFLLLTQTGRRSAAFLDSLQARDSFVLDRDPFDGALVGVDCKRELTRESEAIFDWESRCQRRNV
jgi:hypothetical protein